MQYSALNISDKRALAKSATSSPAEDVSNVRNGLMGCPIREKEKGKKCKKLHGHYQNKLELQKKPNETSSPLNLTSVSMIWNNLLHPELHFHFPALLTTD